MENSDVLVEIQPVGYVNIPVEITVRPHNRMWATYEVQEPPKLTSKLTPIKDAFTREKSEFQAINYGGNYSITVGRYLDEIYRAYLQFDFTEWNTQNVITNAKLKLHYSGSIPIGSKIEILRVDKAWSEYGITHLNRPSPIEMIVSEYNHNTIDKYVEFDFTQIVGQWTENEIANDGFVVRIANESNEVVATFRSRESSRPPELLITYYDGRIYSGGRTQVPAEIYVFSVGKLEALAEITVASVYDSSDILTQIYVHRREVPIESDIETEITISKPNVFAEVQVSIQDESEILAELTVRSAPRSDVRLAEIVISKPYQFVEIYVKNTDTLNAEIEVRKHEDKDKLTEISVSREVVNSEIYVKHIDTIEVEIEVQREIDEDKFVEITVNRTETLTVITSRVLDEDIKDAEIAIRVLREDVRLTEIAVTRTEVLASITVVKSYDVETEIFIKYTNDILAELNVHIWNDVLAEIDVIFASHTEAEVTISRPDVQTVITVPYWEDSDMLTEILPRIFRVSDLNAEIVVSSKKGGAYVFII